MLFGIASEAANSTRLHCRFEASALSKELGRGEDCVGIREAIAGGCLLTQSVMAHCSDAEPRGPFQPIGAGANFDIALDLVHYVMDGLAVSLLTHDIGEHERRMVRYLEDRLRELSSRPAAAHA